MPESDLIKNTTKPHTRKSLTLALRDLGVNAGMTLITHVALGSIGWIAGGHVALIQALMDAVTPQGTLVMPAHSGDLSDPALWENPPVPEEWWPIIRSHWPAYDPRITPTRAIGRTAEAFRTWPDVQRSDHPALSFCAWGANAETIIRRHQLKNALGEESPLARIYDANGWVLLLGCGFESNTSFHLAEYRAPGAVHIQQGAPIIEGGKRVWRTYRDIDLDSDLFPAIGTEFEKTGEVRRGKLGNADIRLFPQRPAVDFAVKWLTTQRASGDNRPGEE